MAEVDADAGAVDDTSLVFGLTTWASGHDAVRPWEVRKKVSSYDVLDDLVAYYMDILRYPNIRVSEEAV
jgi:hypothetical protein